MAGWNRAAQLATLTGTGQAGALSIVTSAVRAMVGAAALVNRKTLQVYNNAGDVIYWAPNSTQCTSAAGFPIPVGASQTWTLTDSVEIWVVGSGNIRVAEMW